MPSETTISPIQTQVSAAITSIEKALSLEDVTGDETISDEVTRKYGRDLPETARAAQKTRGECPEAFSELGRTTEQVQKTQAEVEELGDAEAKAARLLRKIRTRRRQKTELLARDVDDTVLTCRTTLQNPGANRALKAKLAPAAAPLLGQIDGRAAKIQLRKQNTKDLRTQLHTTTDKLSGTESENARLKIENKYLAGDELRPEDVGGGALPLAAKARRRRTPRA